MFESKRLDWPAFLERAWKMGLDGVELNTLFMPRDRNVATDIKRRATKFGLDLCALTLDINLCEPTVAKRERAISSVKQWIDIAALLGVPAMRVDLGWTPKGHTDAEATKWAIQGYKKCVSYAKTKAIVLTMENHGGLSASASTVTEIVEKVGPDWFGLTLDTMNYGTGPQAYDQISKTAKYAVYVHAKTHTLEAGKEGEPKWVERKIDYNRIMEILRGVGYEGYLNIEYEGDEDEETAVTKSVEMMKALLRR
jgi:L-ribulose-5-phosphate 3-epimerase